LHFPCIVSFYQLFLFYQIHHTRFKRFQLFAKARILPSFTYFPLFTRIYFNYLYHTQLH